MSIMTQGRRAIAFFLTAFMAVCSSPHVQGQQINRDDWLRQINDEERKIERYIDRQMTDTAKTGTIRQAFISSLPAGEVQEGDISRLAEDYSRNFYRKQYISLHPELKTIYNPGSVAPPKLTKDINGSPVTNAAKPLPGIICSDGDFEAGASALNSFTGYYSNSYWGVGGLCSFIPYSQVFFTPVPLLPGSHNFDLTNNVPDIHAPINQTRNGSNHAVRINGWWDCGRFAMNMLQKNFSSPVTGKVKINFSYALVMQGPHTSPNQNGNSFFVARVLDYNGNEVGTRKCVSAIDPGFSHVNTYECGTTGPVKTLYRDWDCDFIEFDAEANKSYTIEFFVSGCEWKVHYGYAYVDDICAEISCCPPAPDKVTCVAVPEGNHISWNSVPGAIGYQVTIHSNDPMCCKDSHIQFMSTWTVMGTDTLIPNTFSKCFSYTVNSICKDSTVSETLQKYCSCAPECPPPVNVRCNPVNGGSQLVWDPVPGAAGYQLILHSNDPFCCNNGALQFMAVWTVTGTDTIVPSSFSGCFSWTINTLCGAGGVSQSLNKYCSCTPPCQAPTHLTCFQLPNASVLGWSTVPGAAYYQLVIYNNDPKCCHNGSLPFMAVFNTITTNRVIPTSFSQCFSWYVNTVCEDSSISQTLESSCSCSPDNPDPRLRSQAEENMSRIMSNMTERVQASAAPNPASTYIDFNLLSLDQPSGDSKLVLYLYDINGREIMSRETGYNKNLRVNVAEFPTGTYIYEFKDAGKKIANGKVVIDRH